MPLDTRQEPAFARRSNLALHGKTCEKEAAAQARPALPARTPEAEAPEPEARATPPGHRRPRAYRLRPLPGGGGVSALERGSAGLGGSAGLAICARGPRLRRPGRVARGRRSNPRARAEASRPPNAHRQPVPDGGHHARAGRGDRRAGYRPRPRLLAPARVRGPRADRGSGRALAGLPPDLNPGCPDPRRVPADRRADPRLRSDASRLHPGYRHGSHPHEPSALALNRAASPQPFSHGRSARGGCRFIERVGNAGGGRVRVGHASRPRYRGARGPRHPRGGASDRRRARRSGGLRARSFAA